MAPKPKASSRPADIVRARPRPVTSVAIAVAARGESQYRYSASSDDQCRIGTVEADSTEAALLDAISRVRETFGSQRIRFVLPVPARSNLWALCDEIAALMPGVSIERPRMSDEDLLQQAQEGLRRASPVPAVPSPVYVATDGSVRGRVTGCAWLASSGEYDLHGFRHTTKLIGRKVVLVAELRAIGMAAQKLRGRDIRVLTDSKRALTMVRQWMDGNDVLPEGYMPYRESGKTPGLVVAQRIIFEDRARITAEWVKGHDGEPLNEGADSLARLASRYALGDSGLERADYHRRAEDLADAFSREFMLDELTGR